MYPPGQYGSGMDWMRSIPTEEVVLGSSPFLLNRPGTGKSPFNLNRGLGSGTSHFYTKPGTRYKDQSLHTKPGTR